MNLSRAEALLSRFRYSKDEKTVYALMMFVNAVLVTVIKEEENLVIILLK